MTWGRQHQVSGWKRWILFPPSECPKMALLPWGHPSSRHCNVSFTDLSTDMSRQHVLQHAPEQPVGGPGQPSDPGHTGAR